MKDVPRRKLQRRVPAFVLALLASVLAGPALGAGSLIISEFRVRGPNGANDEFIEIYNDNNSNHTVAAISGTGYGIAASDGVTRCTVPNGTVIPARGHWLCVNSVGYSLASYPAGSGTTATGDATYTTDIPDNAGIALFNNNTGGGSYTLANRLDAVGSSSEANTLYKEGTGYPALSPFSINYSFSRDECGKGGAVNNLTPCTITTPKDSDNNAADFIFNDTNGTSAGAGQRLGAPGPQNLSSPIYGNGSIPNALLDTCSSFAAGTPNYVRNFTSDPANNSTFGTVDIRRTFTNNTGGNVTRLRFRIVDLDTFPTASGFADLRPRTSSPVVVTVDRPPCGSGTSNVTVQGTTLEQPPSQVNGGGFNSSLGVGTVTLATPLANGASVDVRFLFGIQQTGNFRLGIIPEGLPEGGGAADFLMILSCTTDAGCSTPPTVSSIVRAGASPTGAASVDYTVTFSESVTGVDAGDFALTTTGAVAGASVTNVSGSGAVYTVTVGTGTGDGTIRLDVVDDDSIVNGSARPLGGAGAGNGNFTTGEVYTIVHAVTSFSGSSATGTGTVAASFAGGGPGCTFSAAQLLGAPPGVPPVPPVGVPGYTFPHGLFTFNLTGCTNGSTVDFTIVYPAALPAGTQYYKFGPTPTDGTNHWYVLPAVIAGNTATFSITDGGVGDDDLAANGTFVDQGGPGTPSSNGLPVDVPALGTRELLALAVLLAAVGAFLLRQHTG